MPHPRSAFTRKCLFFGLVLAVALASSASGFARGNSLAVFPPKHETEGIDIWHSRSFAIAVSGHAIRTDDLYVFEEASDGCSDLRAELQYSGDAQERYYRFVVHGRFRRSTLWSTFFDSGEHWACAYLAGRAGNEILHRFAPFTIASHPIGRLHVYPPEHPRVGQHYTIRMKGFAARTDSLWIYLASRGCLGWYAFHDSTYADHHHRYYRLFVHGVFSRRTRWGAPRQGRYYACVYLAETAAYPARALATSTSYTIH
jgi:hypothetical protein